MLQRAFEIEANFLGEYYYTSLSILSNKTLETNTARESQAFC